MACILIVEDQEGVRRLLALMLQRFGHEVSEAGDGAAGIALLRGRSFDLVFTDMIMPGKDGGWVIGEVRRLSPGTGIVAMSGGDMDAGGLCPKAAPGRRADRVLPKPFSLAVLQDILGDLLGRRRRPPADALPPRKAAG